MNILAYSHGSFESPLRTKGLLLHRLTQSRLPETIDSIPVLLNNGIDIPV